MNNLINLTLRLAPDLHSKLKSRAEKEGRSLHNLIIYILTNATK